jgi:ribosomal protein S18 acetylase RimI-like enzyme
MIEIRRAASTDAEAMAELRWEFRAGRQPPTEAHDVFIERCGAWMRRELSTPGAWQAWIAVSTRAVVGQVWLQTIAKIPNPIDETERHAYLSNLYVQPSDRGGTGTRLLETAIAQARADQVDRVVLWPSARSVTLYLRHGFSRGGDVMELPLR